MNSTTSKQHDETLWNWNISFQLKKRNTYQNGIDNLARRTKRIFPRDIIFHQTSLKRYHGIEERASRMKLLNIWANNKWTPWTKPWSKHLLQKCIWGKYKEEENKKAQQRPYLFNYNPFADKREQLNYFLQSDHVSSIKISKFHSKPRMRDTPTPL